MSYKEESIYDKIIVGSSPLALMEAIRLVKSNERIMVLEQKEKLGGAWENISVMNFNSVEAACHLLENYDGAYHFMKTYYDFDFEEMLPSPRKYYTQDINVRYDAPFNPLYRLSFVSIALVKQILFTIYYTFLFKKKNASFESKKIKKSLKNIKNNFGRLKKRLTNKVPIQYFKGGSGCFITYLTNWLIQEKVDIKVSQKIEQLEVEKDCVILHCGDKTYSTKEIIMTQGSAIPKIITSETNICLEIFSKEIHHCHILVENVKEKLFSYLQFVNDEEIHRVTDITEYTRNIPANHRLFLFELRLNHLFINAEWLINHLVTYNVFPSNHNTKIIDWERTTFKYKTMNEIGINSVQLLADKHSSIRLLRSKGDLTRGIKYTYLDESLPFENYSKPKKHISANSI